MADTTPSTQSQGGRALTESGILRAAVMLVIGFLLSRVLGLIRESILAGVFGGRMEYEAYAAALRPPDTIFLVVAGGALGSAFIPAFATYLVRGERDQAWRMGSAVANLITVILMVVALVTALLARPVVAPILVGGRDPQFQALTASLMQIMLISPVIFGVSGLLMGVLNAHQRFLLPALAPSLYNLGIIFGALVLSPSMGIYGAAWGAVIGAALHLAVQLPGLIALSPKYTPAFDLRHPGVREVARLMAPRVLGLAVTQINFWVNVALASSMVEGSIAALTRAWFVMLMPQGIIAQSVANAVFPTFAVHVASNDTGALRGTLAQVLRAVLFLSIPASVALILLRLPIVRVIYDYGAFTNADAQATAWALLFFALGLVAHSLVEIVTRAFYALHDTRTPVIIGGGAMALNVILSLLFIRMIGVPGNLEHGPFAGLALANTLATTIEGLLLLILIRPRVGGLDMRPLLIGIGRAILASAGMGVVLWLMLPLIDALGLYVGLTIVMVIGGLVFWGLALMVGSQDARTFTAMALQQIRRTLAQ
jgi:putative peptidoglycan lipid II flippase